MGKASGFGHPSVSGFRGECCWISASLSSSHQGCLLKMSPNLFVSGAGLWEVTILRENSSHPKNGWLGSMKCPLKNNPISRFYRRVFNFRRFFTYFETTNIWRNKCSFPRPSTSDFVLVRPLPYEPVLPDAGVSR